MKLMRAVFFCSAFAVIWLVGAEAKAGPVSWQYNWSRDGDAGTVGNQDRVMSDNGASYVQLSDEPTTPSSGFYTTKSTVVTATNLTLSSSALPTEGDTFTAKTFNLTITINDELFGPGSASFQLQFDGKVSKDGSDDLDVKLLTPMPQVIVRGENTYTITLPKFGFYAPAPPPGASNKGGISFAVTVTNEDDPNPPDAPEPGTVLLSCVGLAGLGLAGVRKWARRKAA